MPKALQSIRHFILRFMKTFQNKTYPMDFSLDTLENQLNPTHLFRINRKRLINMQSIVNMTAYSRSRLKL